MPDQSRRILAVLVAVCLGLAAAATWLFDAPTAAGFSLRSGILVAALWLAWPELTRRSFRKFAVIATAALLVILRPRAAWVVVPAMLIWLGARRR